MTICTRTSQSTTQLVYPNATHETHTSQTRRLFNVSVSVNVEFKVTLHEQVRCRGILQYKQLQSVTQLDAMVKSTMTETVAS